MNEAAPPQLAPQQWCPTIRVGVDGRWLTADSSRPFLIGRGDDVSLDLPSPLISRHHAVLEHRGDGWSLTDLSRNGTFVGDRRISRIRVEANLTVSLGSADHGVGIRLIPESPGQGSYPATLVADDEATEQGRLSAVHTIRQGRIRIGRETDNDVVLGDLLVSRHHAELLQSSDRWRLTDLGTGNGTFLNGVRVHTAPVTNQDVIGIGRALLRLDGDRLVEYVDSGDNTFDAESITVTTKSGVTLLHSVSFSLPGKAMMAVVGPSGAGKSTLLHALVGTRPAGQGEVRYAGRSRYADYDELRHRVALVPQDDALHTS